LPYDIDLRPSSSRVRFAGLAGRLRGDAAAPEAPLVFLHGLTFDRRMWDPILDALPAERRAIAFDLPGHGASRALDRHDLEHVVDALHEAIVASGLESPVLVGHSIGAGIASIYAARYPSSGVVNVDGGVRIEGLVAFVQSIAPQLHGDFDTVWSTIFRSSMGIERVPVEQQPLLRAGHDVDRDLVLGYWTDLLTRTRAELSALIDDHTRLIAAARLPYLAVMRDPLSLEDEAWLLERIPWADVAVWPVGHHFPHLEHPTRFAALIATFAE
jgi:pimeloyl-ACP methyl ester carboxylesterase